MLPITRITVLAVLLLSVSACMTRSISDSGYRSWYRSTDYKGELSEFDVLGIRPDEDITEAQIAEAYAKEHRVQIPKGAPVLLIQSGAAFPDAPMQSALEEWLRVTPLSGVPSVGSSGNLSSRMRLVAAQGGYDFILCYWGILESSQINLATKALSWTPIIGRGIPDEAERMRIQVKMAVIDGRTGQWAMVSVAPEGGRNVSARVNREQADQALVEELKEKGYRAVADELVKQHIVQ